MAAPWWNTPTNINQRGDVVGFAGDPAFPDGDILHGFIWTERDGIKPLGALPGHIHSEAYGINEKRQVVGISCDANFVDCRAFIWENGVMQDLNALKPPSYTARSEQAKTSTKPERSPARSINASGVRRAFLAAPGEDGADD